MAKKIEKLTEEQTSKFPHYVQKWTDIGLCTKPADRPRAERGIVAAYAVAKLKAPRIVWCESPLKMYLTIQAYKSISADPKKIKAAENDPNYVNRYMKANQRKLYAEAQKGLDNTVYGQHDAGWMSFYDFFRTECGLVEQTEQLQGLSEISQSAGWFVPFEHICFICERHSILRRNAEGQLHCEDGPAVQYPDGWSVYAINGILCDEQIIMRPETQNVKQINNESNADRRAIRIERFGWTRYLKESKAKLIDERANDVEGTLEALYSIKGNRRFVATCPTGRVFTMGVPESVRTCEQAQNWLGNQPLDEPSRCLFRT